MEFRYTKHAEEKLLERKLSTGMVENVVSNPDNVEPTRFDRKIASRSINGKMLRVVYAEEGNVYIIITAYYTEKNRY